MPLSTYYCLAISCFVLSLALGMLFSIMESAILTLNRVRLLQLFGDTHHNGFSEQHIFRETKEVYLVSRLGLSATLVLCGFSLAWLLIQFFRVFAGTSTAMWPVTSGVG
ncbi:TPA: hypothetical protein DDW35_07060, partial [Candidatus Sumerlaeota bacterium]|nr:hypothetical protein [Candidatus Sumerlaeota bacterium]